MKTIRFIKEEDGKWFADLPEYLAASGDRDNLEMIAGSREIIELMAGSARELSLLADTAPFLGSDELALCQGDGNGGGYYEMKTFQQIPVDHELWLCELLQLLFGALPDRIYIRQQSAN